MCVPRLKRKTLHPPAHELASLVMKLRQRQIKGVDELNLWSAGNLLPTAYARGRMIRFLSKLYESTRGLLCVNVGASATSVAAGFAGELDSGRVSAIWAGGEFGWHIAIHRRSKISCAGCSSIFLPNTLREYLFQKSLYPSAIPATKDEQAIAQAIARQALYLAVRTAQKDFPAQCSCLTERCDAAAGSDHRGRRRQSAMGHRWDKVCCCCSMRIQPVGIMPILLDQNNLLPYAWAWLPHAIIICRCR